MYALEAALMTIIVFLGVYSSYTDIRSGIIRNKALICATLIGIPVNAAYYAIFAREYVTGFAINLGCMALISVLLYYFEFWAAGDSKLLLCFNFLFPARLYGGGANKIAPGIDAVVFTFLVALAFVAIDSIICAIKKSYRVSGKELTTAGLTNFAKHFIVSLLYMRIIGTLIRTSLGEIYAQNQMIFGFVNVFVAIFIYKFDFIKSRISILITVIINIIILYFTRPDISSFIGYAFLAIVLILRYLLGKYNYKQIPVEELSAGMVLSKMNIILFEKSRVKGLPQSAGESIRDKISDDDVEAVKRWSKSKYGSDKVTIVRKIPFAIFIFAGEAILFTIRTWKG